MTPYAEMASLRVRQQLSDAAALAWTTGWVLAGRAAYRTIEELRRATSSAEDAGAGLANRLQDVARSIGGVPLVGRELRRPFNGAASAGRSLEAAGAAAGDTVHTVALAVAFAVIVLPVALLLARYVPSRLRWMREATAARRLRDGSDDALYLFALRAAAGAPLHKVRRAEPDPVGALARGDYRSLARLELERFGLRLAE